MEIAIVAIFFSAGFLQGLTSFGLNLFSIPLLALFLDIKLIVPVLVCYSLILNIILYKKIGSISDLLQVKPLLISSIIFTIIGAFLLKELPTDAIKTVIGVLLVGTAFMQLSGKSMNADNPGKYYIPAGILTGLLNGSIGLGGPAILLFLSNMKVSKNQFRSILASLFVVLNVITIAMYVVTDIFNQEALKISLLYFPSVVFGLYSGYYFSEKLNEQLFKKIILILMGVMGAVMLY